MRILVAAASHAYSFINQASALVDGLRQNQISVQLVLVKYQDDLRQGISDFNPNLVIGVSNWIDYPLITEVVRSAGVKILPWIVCDEDKITKFVDEYNKLSLVATVSDHCRNNLIRSGIKAELLVIIPEAVDSENWFPEESGYINVIVKLLTTPNPNKDDIKFDLDKARSQGIPIIYTTGGDPTKKGAREIMKALSLIDRNIPWIYLIKTWPSVDIFKTVFEEITLAENLKIWGRVRYIVGEFSLELMRHLVNLGEIYAAPSRSEGFGLPLVEAAMCGKPVVTCTGTAAEETVVQGETGFVARRDDIDELAGYLEKLIVDKPLREKLGKRGREMAVEKYSPKVIGQKFLDIINE